MKLELSYARVPVAGATTLELPRASPTLELSYLSALGTRLPPGLVPPPIAAWTGGLVVGEPLLLGSTVERTVRYSVDYIKKVAAALPLDAEDERTVDALFAAREAALPPPRPLRRREGGEPR